MNEIAHLWESFWKEMIWMSVSDMIRELLAPSQGPQVLPLPLTPKRRRQFRM